MVPEKSNIRGEPKLARGRNPEIKPKMDSELKTTLPQAGTAFQPNPAVGYYREKDPVAGAGPMDFGGGQTHEPVAEVARLASVAALATSDADADRKFSKLRKELEALGGFIEGKKNIHKELKEMARSALRALKEFEKVRLKRSVIKVRPSDDRATQTSPIFKKGVALPDGRRERSSPGPTSVAKKTKVDGKKRVTSEIPKPPDGEWATVAKKGRPSKKQERAEQGTPIPVQRNAVKAASKYSRPDAIKIRASGGIQYADILKRVKTTPDLAAVGERVTRIRRTRAGELLLELGKTGAETPVLQRAIASSLNESAIVTALTHKEYVIVMDIDEATEIAEVAEAVSMVIGPDRVTPDVIKMRGSYSGTKAATIALPAGVANKLVKAGRVRIGWVNCRVRFSVVKCYKCLESGHISRNCKSKLDRSKQCFQCGKEGHKKVACPNVNNKSGENPQIDNG